MNAPIKRMSPEQHEQWLRALLERNGGRMTKDAIMKCAVKAGHSPSAVARASAHMNLIYTRERPDSVYGTYWALRGPGYQWDSKRRRYDKI